MADALSVEQKKDLYHRFNARLQAGDLNGLAELIDVDEYRDLCPGVTPGWVDFETAKKYFAQIYAAIPDVAMKDSNIIVGDDMIVALSSSTATNGGPFFGAPASGKRVDFDSVSIMWLRNGKIVRRYVLPDLLTLIRQAGFVPFLNLAMGGDRTLPAGD